MAEASRSVVGGGTPLPKRRRCEPPKTPPLHHWLQPPAHASSARSDLPHYINSALANSITELIDPEAILTERSVMEDAHADSDIDHQLTDRGTPVTGAGITALVETAHTSDTGEAGTPYGAGASETDTELPTNHKPDRRVIARLLHIINGGVCGHCGQERGNCPAWRRTLRSARPVPVDEAQPAATPEFQHYQRRIALDELVDASCDLRDLITVSGVALRDLHAIYSPAVVGHIQEAIRALLDAEAWFRRGIEAVDAGLSVNLGGA